MILNGELVHVCLHSKTMDLKTCEFVEPCRDDYMCISTGYEYVDL